MKTFGIELEEGTSIARPVIESGTDFPGSRANGQLFIKTGSNPGLYLYNQNIWTYIVSSEGANSGWFSSSDAFIGISNGISGSGGSGTGYISGPLTAVSARTDVANSNANSAAVTYSCTTPHTVIVNMTSFITHPDSTLIANGAIQSWWVSVPIPSGPNIGQPTTSITDNITYGFTGLTGYGPSNTASSTWIYNYSTGFGGTKTITAHNHVHSGSYNAPVEVTLPAGYNNAITLSVLVIPGLNVLIPT